MKKLVIIPAYNEEKNLIGVIKDIQKYYSEDILIINDGSTDETAKIIKQFDFKTIHHERNQGYGASLIDGFHFATENKYELVITIDGDGQHEARFINKIFEFLLKYELVFGSRFPKELPVLNQIPKNRLAGNMLYRDLINHYTDFEITDAFSGYRGYRVEVLKKIELKEKRYGFPLELWMQLNKLNHEIKLKEIPIPLKYLDYSRNFNDNFKSDKEMFDYLISVFLKQLIEVGIINGNEEMKFYAVLNSILTKEKYSFFVGL